MSGDVSPFGKNFEKRLSTLLHVWERRNITGIENFFAFSQKTLPGARLGSFLNRRNARGALGGRRGNRRGRQAGARQQVDARISAETDVLASSAAAAEDAP